MSEAALLFLSGSMAGKGSKLKGDLIILGRSSSCDISVKDPSISREHVKFFIEDGTYILEDLNSNNGVKYEGEKIVRLELHTGMKFFIGKVEVQFVDPSQAPMVAEVNGGVGAVEPIGNDDYGLSAAGNEADADDDLSKIHALKMKRLNNIIILCCIIAALALLGGYVVNMMMKKERKLHTRSIKMYTNEQLIIDLNFRPIGSSEKLLSPFVVSDFDGYDLKFGSNRTGITASTTFDKPKLGSAMLIKTKTRTGSGSITFYTFKDEKRFDIGVLNVNVLRRPVPGIVADFATAGIAEKISKAKDVLIDYNKNKDNAEKRYDNWKKLKDAKSIFYGSQDDAKPDIYFSIEKAFYHLTKEIERATRDLYSRYDIALNAKEFAEMKNILANVLEINPNGENLYRQKASILRRRIILILKRR